MSAAELFDQTRGLIGIAVLMGIAWALSENRRGHPGWRWMAGALAMQGLLALLIVRVPPVWAAVGLVNDAVGAVEAATLKGSSYMFGYLGGAELPFALKPGAQPPLVIAFQILPLVIVFSALSALLWHWGVLRWMVNGLGYLLRRSLGVSGVVGLSGGASVFLGVVEAPLVTRAWFGRMSRAELFQIMALTMATISGAILILYATTLRAVVPDAVGHMIAASLISLPAALLVARLMVPPGAEDAATEVDTADPGLRYEGSIDAIVKGTMDGMQLFLAVIAVIITVFALVALVDMALALLPLIDGAPLTLKRILGWALAPLMWLIGVPWSEAQAAGGLMGTKAVLNEYVAYLELAALAPGTLGPRATLIVTYALCGVANLASVGLLVSTIGTLAPERRAEAAGLGMKSWVAGNLASAMTGAWIGLVTLA
ncbi:NupC/NupG family nucleoside CNT transporter [Erythrobacter sp. WG]|uniref:NupC/NupG family nucleoside CNT transporter n=1 Tax=Erythrobacter sp. WG TaxID=2985510 RepID=UPI00226DA69C|nr:nucleoside transporter C-terminal domain-containing protein [Erythrobacter sp. WG]MCX9147210.1 nucleoside:proton symporter [Erythrobacter sp. WG]